MTTSPRMADLQRLLKKIPYGKVTTYREIAHALGTRGYQAVGQLLGANPEPDKYPCCKVVKSDGTLGGYALGQKQKIRRLQAEGIVVHNSKIVDFKKRLYTFSPR